VTSSTPRGGGGESGFPQTRVLLSTKNERLDRAPRCRSGRRMKVKCSCSTAAPVGKCWWARVTDVAKRRRQARAAGKPRRAAFSTPPLERLQ
jgi:hypothetical protein